MGNYLACKSIFIEIGRKKTLAGAIDWPGWCCSGKDETDALPALETSEAGHLPKQGTRGG